MDILIKGMKMPKDCPMCPLSHWNLADHFTGCQIVAGKRYAMQDPEYAASIGRPKWCPLVAVPDHGRLIDADCCNGYFYEHMSDDMMIAAMNAINEMPTIIPADKEGEE